MGQGAPQNIWVDRYHGSVKVHFSLLHCLHQDDLSLLMKMDLAQHISGLLHRRSAIGGGLMHSIYLYVVAGLNIPRTVCLTSSAAVASGMPCTLMLFLCWRSSRLSSCCQSPSICSCCCTTKCCNCQIAGPYDVIEVSASTSIHFWKKAIPSHRSTMSCLC